MVGYDNDANALTLGDDDSLSVGDYELEYNSTDDQWQARYGRPIGGEVGNHGDIVNGVYSNDSEIGDKSLQFAGNGLVKIQNSKNLQPDGGDFSISAWVKPDGISTYHVVSTRNENSVGYQLRILDDGSIRFMIGKPFDQPSTRTFRDSDISIPEGQYTHIVATWNNSLTEINLYIDGSLQNGAYGDESLSAGDVINSNDTVRLASTSGKDEVEPTYSGLIDDVRFYKRELTSSEVTDLSNKVNVSTGLEARYDFEYPETPERAIDSTGEAFPKNAVPRSTTDSLVPQGLAESISAGEALADDGEMYDSVQEAVDNADGWVFVGPGTFNESVTIDTEGLTLEGCGYDTLIDGGSSTVVDINADNVTLRNLSVQTNTADGGSGVSVDSANVTVDSVTVRQSGDRGIQTSSNTGVNNATISNCVIRDCELRGLVLDTDGTTGAGGHVVTGTLIEDCGKDGIILWTDRGDNCIISNCIIRNNADNGVSVNGANSIIIGNRITENENGIGVSGDGQDNIIANNRISDSSGSDTFDDGTGTELNDNLTGASN